MAFAFFCPITSPKAICLGMVMFWLSPHYPTSTPSHRGSRHGVRMNARSYSHSSSTRAVHKALPASPMRQVELDGAYSDQGLTFPGPLGGPIDPSVLTRTFEKLVRRIGLTNTRLHDLRHFHATLLLQQGTNPKVVQERLGHSSFAITMDTYSHVAPGLQKQPARDFALAMGKAKPLDN